MHRVFSLRLREGREALDKKRILRPSVEECSDVELIIRQILQLTRRHDQIKHLFGAARPFTAVGFKSFADAQRRGTSFWNMRRCSFQSIRLTMGRRFLSLRPFRFVRKRICS